MQLLGDLGPRAVGALPALERLVYAGHDDLEVDFATTTILRVAEADAARFFMDVLGKEQQGVGDRARVAAARGLWLISRESTHVLRPDFLIAGLSDQNPDVRNFLMLACGSLAPESPELVRSLCDRAKREPMASIRFVLINTLRTLPTEDLVVSTLSMVMANDTDSAVRFSAALGLVQTDFAPLAVARLLAELALAELEEDLRHSALYAFAVAGPAAATALPYLRNVILSDSNWRVRRAALVAVQEIAHAPSGSMPGMVDAVGAQLGDAERELRLAAALCLRELAVAGCDVSPIFVRAILEDPATEVRWAAYSLAEALGPSAASLVPELRQGLKVRGLRTKAAEALAAVGCHAHVALQELRALLPVVSKEERAALEAAIERLANAEEHER